MGEQTLLAVRQWRLARGPAKMLFPDQTYHGFVRDSFNPLMERAGLGRGRKTFFTPHTLRHVAASLWIEQGSQPKRVQQLLGHSTITLTMDLYGHLWVDDENDDALARDTETLILKKNA